MIQGLPPTSKVSVALGLLLLGGVFGGCSSLGGIGAHPPSDPGFEFFAKTSPDADIWFAKVSEWQQRASLQQAQRKEPLLGPESEGAQLSSASVKNSGLLRLKIGGFAADEKRRLAKKINTWSQREARRHYRIEDERDPRKDNWPTFDELLANNGDDCDGLDLIVYGLLIDFGFEPDRVYRAIVKRDRDRGNHMVTLWFEDPHDPWVLDATGAMTFTMLRFSETEGWTPIKVFNERAQYRALPSEETLSLNEN